MMPWAIAALLFACGDDGRRVDVSGYEVEVPIVRLDKALFNADADRMEEVNARLSREHGSFYRTYVETILQGPPMEDPQLPLMLAQFITDPDWQATQRSVDSVLGDLGPQQALFDLAFSRMKALFPDSLTPRIYAFNSGFNYGIVPTDSVLGIGLEWFIGADHPVIGMLAPERFPQYVKDRMRPELLVPSAVKGWLLVHYTRNIRGADLLTHLVETGKVMALQDALLPELASDLKFTFTQEQMDWCGPNEQNIWKQLVEGEMLFSTNEEVIGRIMNDGPFTPGFPRESPGHIGEYIGARMVQSYLADHPEVSLADLFAIEDPNTILKSYKPR